MLPVEVELGDCVDGVELLRLPEPLVLMPVSDELVMPEVP